MRPLVVRRKSESKSASGAAEFKQVIESHGERVPESHEFDNCAPSFYALSEETTLTFTGRDELTDRDLLCLCATLRGEKVHLRYRSDQLLVVPLDRSHGWGKQRRDIIDYCCTLGPGAKLYIVVRSPLPETCLRPFTINEMQRLQGGCLQEHLSLSDILRLSQVLNYRSMTRLIWHSYHLTVELIHFLASAFAHPRFD